jgi:molecular chaperone GrpE
MSDENNQKIEYEQENEEGDSVDLVEKIKKIKEQLKHCQQEKQEYLNGWQRSQADFINYKRRQEEQLAEWFQMAGEKIIREILPVLDTLETRNLTDKDTDENGKNIKAGLKMTREQLMKVLGKNGLEEIKSIGEKFNPEFHEAMERVEADAPEGIVVEEVQKGYMMNGKVLRAAKVKVIKN